MMFNGNWLDSADAWPLLAWPFFYFSIINGLFLFNKNLEQNGQFSYDESMSNFLLLVINSILSILSVIMFVYIFYVVGIKSLILIPLMAFGSIFFAKIAKYVPYYNIVYQGGAVFILFSLLTLRNIFVLESFAKLNYKIVKFLM